MALKWIASHSFSKSAGDRNNAANIVIVMTDGKSRNSSLTKQEANRLHRAGIKVFAIGIGNKIFKDELKNIASSPENVFTVVSFSVLDTILSQLKKSTCKGKTA
jgi:collagen type VI alpha